MRILDRYIVKKAFLSYLFIIVSFVGLYLIAELFTNLSDFIRAKATLGLVAEYYLNLLPFMYVNTTAFALSIAVAFTLGELNRSNEIVCMRASGVSIFRIAWPLLILSLVLSFTTFVVQEKILTRSQKKAEDIKMNYIEYSPDKRGVEENIIFYSTDKLIIADKFIPKENKLENVKILKEDRNGNIKEQIIAKNIVYQQNKWIASNVINYKLDRSGSIVDIPILSKEKKLELDEKPHTIAFKSMSGQDSFAMQLPLKVLKQKIKNIKSMQTSSKVLNKAIVDYHEKVSRPFAHFFLTLGVIPFAIEIRKRKAATMSLVWGVLFGILYFALFSVSIPLGREAHIIPQLSAWVAPLFFLAIGGSGLILMK